MEHWPAYEAKMKVCSATLPDTCGHRLSVPETPIQMRSCRFGFSSLVSRQNIT